MRQESVGVWTRIARHLDFLFVYWEGKEFLKFRILFFFSNSSLETNYEVRVRTIWKNKYDYVTSTIKSKANEKFDSFLNIFVVVMFYKSPNLMKKTDKLG